MPFILGLKEVARPAKVKEAFGEYKLSNPIDSLINKELTPEQKKLFITNKYVDKMIDAELIVLNEQILIIVKNVTTRSIKLIWDEASFVDLEGHSSRIIHGGTKLIEKEKAQVPSIIAPNAKINDVVTPADNIFWDVPYDGGGKWKYKTLIKVENKDKEKQLEQLKEIYIGKTVQLILPLKIEDVTNEYIFTFVIEDIIGKTSDSSSCFIVTACTGVNSYELNTFYHFRDRILLGNNPGNSFIQSYYKHSPAMAEWLSKKKILKYLIRYLIIHPVARIINLYFAIAHKNNNSK